MKLPISDLFRKLTEDLLAGRDVDPVEAFMSSRNLAPAEDIERIDQQDALNALPVYQTLRDSVKEGMTLDELIDAFAAMCKLPVGEPDDLLFETGTYNFTGKKLFYFSLVRQFQYKSGDEYIQLRLDVCYAPSPATARICDTEWGSLTEDDFFGMVRSSKAYQKVKDAPMAEVEVRIEET